MAEARLHAVVRHVRRLADAKNVKLVSDDELIDSFCKLKDESAFAELVRRHGPMVGRVCRTVLPNHHDAEDAFQATFMVLARKAESVRRTHALCGWLYRVAYRTALRARHRGKPLSIPQAAAPVYVASDPVLDLSVRELHKTLYEELDRLATKYRLPLVLCHLEGMSQEEAANRLGWTSGMVRGRLNRGRAELRKRLTRRGLALTAALWSWEAMPVQAALSGALVAATVRNGLAFRDGSMQAVTTSTAELAESGLRSLFFTKAKTSVLGAVVIVLLTPTMGVLAFQALGKASSTVANLPALKSAEQTDSQPATIREKTWPDLFGDPLPAGVIARLGTVRMRHAGVGIVRFMPDGKNVLSHGLDGIRIWSIADGKLLRYFPSKLVGAWQEPKCSFSVAANIAAIS
jgi:RNA polymerase sigma factor (sigma-70 family)